MKRSITQNMLKRLAAQANEADIYGHIRIADNLTLQVSKYAKASAVREDEEEYTYDRDELLEDVRQLMWDAATRIFDFIGDVPDGRDVDLIVEDMADNLLSSLESLTHSDGVGKYETKTPGEEANDESKEGVKVNWEISLPSDITDEEEVEEEDDDGSDDSEDEDDDTENESSSDSIIDMIEDIVEGDEPEEEEESEDGKFGTYDGNDYRIHGKGDKDLTKKDLLEDRQNDNDPESNFK